MDSGIAQGSPVLAFYDPLVAKLIAHGRTREEAIARMERAVGEFVIEGVQTVLPLHRRILADEAFRNGELTTTFLGDRDILEGLVQERDDEVAAIAATLASRPSLAAHLRERLVLQPANASRWAVSGRPRPGGEHAAAHRGRWART